MTRKRTNAPTRHFFIFLAQYFGGVDIIHYLCKKKLKTIEND